MKKPLEIFTLCLLGIGITMTLGIFGAKFTYSRKQIIFPDTERDQRRLSKGSFTLPTEAYHCIGEQPPLHLSFTSPKTQLPNLQPQISYYGPNGRPDMGKDNPPLHFVLNESKSQVSALANEKIYLLYDRTISPPHYVFSPNNTVTPLWIQAEAKENEAVIHVFLKNECESDHSVNSIDFTSPKKEFVQNSQAFKNWNIGKWHVDATILTRQQAKWHGPDKFLEQHGGEEFEHLINKQRIDFTEGEDPYSLYISLNDILVWKDDRWQISSGDNSIGYPLLQVKKIEDRLMSLTLWDIEGKNRLNINLLKTNEPCFAQPVQQQFKFISARTRSQYIFEINKKKFSLQPKDWLLLSDNEWTKLSTEQEIDDYVNRKIRGSLFVFHDIIKKEEGLFLSGTFFNASRSNSQSVEFPLPQANNLVLNPPTDSNETMDACFNKCQANMTKKGAPCR